MEEALIQFSTGKVVQPVRSIVAVEKHSGRFGLCPAVYKDGYWRKTCERLPRNAVLGLHTHTPPFNFSGGDRRAAGALDAE